MTLVTVAQAAKELGVNERRVRAMLANPRHPLAGERFGERAWAVSRASLDAELARRGVSPTTENER